MSSDGLPLAYSSMEIYDMVVELRGIIKMEKEALLELGTFFTLCNRFGYYIVLHKQRFTNLS